MANTVDLTRFTDAQHNDYDVAFHEIKSGRKRSHWMWYIFPQISGLGSSATSVFYGIKSLAEAQAYITDPLLGSRLVQMAKLLLESESTDPLKIFGDPDYLKLRSCMTLFASVHQPDPVFQQVLDKFFQGVKDQRTLSLLRSSAFR